MLQVFPKGLTKLPTIPAQEEWIQRASGVPRRAGGQRAVYFRRGNAAALLLELLELLKSELEVVRGGRYSTWVKKLDRITFDPAVMGGKPCLRGMRLTVGAVVGMFAAGHTKEEILRMYPYAESEDVDQALEYAAWRVMEVEAPLAG